LPTPLIQSSEAIRLAIFRKPHALYLDALDVMLQSVLAGDAIPVKEALIDDARARLNHLVSDPTIHRGVAAQARVVVDKSLSVIAPEAHA
jgi:hypothetical protein